MDTSSTEQVIISIMDNYHECSHVSQTQVSDHEMSGGKICMNYVKRNSK